MLKAQKEEQEAHKKRSDLEIELMKRQQKLEQVNDRRSEMYTVFSALCGDAPCYGV